MNDDDLERFIIEHIGKGIHPDDVVLAVCQRQGWSWAEARDFVESVQLNQYDQIERQHLGLKLVLAAGVILAGTGMLSLSGYLLILPVIGMDYPVGADPVSMVRDAGLSMTVLYILLTTGISMIVGGILGMIALFSRNR